MPSRQYLEADALSFHALRDFGRHGPRYYYRKHVLKCEPWRGSAAMAMGTAIHMAILEPHLFGKSYAVLPAEHLTPGGMPSQSKAAKAWRADNADKDFLSPDQWAVVMSCRDAVLDHKPAKVLLDQCTEFEVEKYLDEFHGFKAKGCADALAPNRVVDVKTISDIHLVRQHMDSYDYRHQLAWYAKLFGKSGPGRLIFVETQEPYRVMVVEPHWREEARAWGEVVDWCDTLRQCYTEDRWDLASDYDKLQAAMAQSELHSGVAVI